MPFKSNKQRAFLEAKQHEIGGNPIMTHQPGAMPLPHTSPAPGIAPTLNPQMAALHQMAMGAPKQLSMPAVPAVPKPMSTATPVAKQPVDEQETIHTTDNNAFKKIRSKLNKDSI